MFSLSSKPAVRHAISMTMGIGAAVGLFLLMQGLISQRDVSLYLDRSAPIPEFIRLNAPEEVITHTMVSAWQMRGYMLSETGRPREAFDAFEKAPWL